MNVGRRQPVPRELGSPRNPLRQQVDDVRYRNAHPLPPPTGGGIFIINRLPGATLVSLAYPRL